MSTPELRQAKMTALHRRAAELREAIEAQRQTEQQLRETEQRHGRLLRPEVAQRFVLLGVDLAGVLTYGTLEAGVARALVGAEREI